MGSLKKNGPVLGVISGDTIQGPPVIGGRMEGREHGGARVSARLASKTKSKIRSESSLKEKQKSKKGRQRCGEIYQKKL